MNLISVEDVRSRAPLIQLLGRNLVCVTQILLDMFGRRRVLCGTIDPNEMAYVQAEVAAGNYHKTFCLVWDPADERRLAKEQ